MSTEELQLIFTMVEQAGEGAFTLACVYLVVGLIKATFAPGVWILFFLLVYKGGRYFFDTHQTNKVDTLEQIKSRIHARLDWVKRHYPATTEEAARNFVEGKANTVDVFSRNI